MKKILNMVLSISVAIAYWIMRISYFVFDDFLFNGAAFVILSLFAVNAVFSIYYVMTKRKSKIVFVNFGVSVFGFIVNTAIFVTTLDCWLYYLREFVAFLPYLLILCVAFFLIYLYPKTELHKNKIVSGAMITIILLFMINSVVSFVPFSFRSLPVVFEAGEQYTIVWTTTSKATGWIEYKDKTTGELIKVYEEDGGAVRTDKKVHKVTVDKNALVNNTYTAKSQRILMHLSNDVTKGRIIQSLPIAFKGYSGGDDVSLLCLPDIHGFANAAIKASRYFEDFDFLVLLGDMASQLSSESEIINSILKVSNKVTGGRVPVLVARGNHDTRGRMAGMLKDYIGLPNDSYYYTFNYGPLSAVILDSAEDKEDNHREYSGLARFTEYKNKQTEWLNNLVDSGFFNNPASKYNIVISHIPMHNIKDWNNMKDWLEIFNTLNIDAQFCGHWHKAFIYDADSEHNFPIITTGGREGNFGLKYTAMHVNMTKPGATVTAYNQKGEAVLIKTLD